MTRPIIVTAVNKDNKPASEELNVLTENGKATAIANRPKKIYGFLAMLIRASVIGGSS